MSETVDSLLDAAEIAMRSRGYHGVSFRELADDVGIKSASVHYYFPQKEDLAVALVTRYSETFFADLDKRAGSVPSSQMLRTFCDAYRSALERSERGCLCGMLGAESWGLPKPVADAVAAFFEANMAWIGRALPKGLAPRARRIRSAQILAALQGGMMIATALKDRSLFDGVIKRVLADNAA
jgi:TetR/AcrR family transcriptional repressor of nem operon